MSSVYSVTGQLCRHSSEPVSVSGPEIRPPCSCRRWDWEFPLAGHTYRFSHLTLVCWTFARARRVPAPRIAKVAISGRCAVFFRLDLSCATSRASTRPVRLYPLINVFWDFCAADKVVLQVLLVSSKTATRKRLSSSLCFRFGRVCPHRIVSKRCFLILGVRRLSNWACVMH